MPTIMSYIRFYYHATDESKSSKMDRLLKKNLESFNLRFVFLYVSIGRYQFKNLSLADECHVPMCGDDCVFFQGGKTLHPCISSLSAP